MGGLAALDEAGDQAEPALGPGGVVDEEDRSLVLDDRRRDGERVVVEDEAALRRGTRQSRRDVGGMERARDQRRRAPRAERVGLAHGASRLARPMGPTLPFVAARYVGGREEDLRPPNAGGDANHVEQLDRLVDEHRVVLLHAERRHPAAHVAGERRHLLERHGVDLAIAGELRQRLQIERRVAGHDREAHAVAIAARDQRLEDLLRRGGRPWRRPRRR